MSPKGQSVVLTGAASGIGAELLIQLRDAGFRVVGADINPLSHRKDIYTYQCDLSDPQEIEGLFEFASNTLGSIDIFIANAGFAYFENPNHPSWKRTEMIFKVNSISPIYCFHKMKSLLGDKPFQMMITASAMSYWPLPGYAQYSGTKAAIHGFVTAARHELGRDQHLQIIYPIGTRTSFFGRAGNSPVPFLTQSAEEVARKIIEGLESKKKVIYLSFLFRVILLINRFLPILRPLVIAIERRNFQKWQAGNMR